MNSSKLKLENIQPEVIWNLCSAHMFLLIQWQQFVSNTQTFNGDQYFRWSDQKCVKYVDMLVKVFKLVVDYYGE